MLHKFLRSIYYPDEKTGRSFAADAIISNPPSFAHVHIAEMAGLPLIISFSECMVDLGVTAGSDSTSTGCSNALVTHDRVQPSAR